MCVLAFWDDLRRRLGKPSCSSGEVYLGRNERRTHDRINAKRCKVQSMSYTRTRDSVLCMLQVVRHLDDRISAPGRYSANAEKEFSPL
jgi:hypothetical protein